MVKMQSWFPQALKNKGQADLAFPTTCKKNIIKIKMVFNPEDVYFT